MALSLPAPTLFYREKLKDQAVSDVARFLEIPRDQVYDFAAEWLAVGPALFAQHGPENFYYAWRGDAGRANLCSNAIFQFQRPEIWTALHAVAQQTSGLTYLDFGCGSGTLSFPFAPAFQQAVFADLPNLAQDFLRWRIQFHGLSNAIAAPPDLLANQRECANVISCIDVLEHVAASTALFEKIDALLVPGGLLLFSAPWHSIDSQVEHLPEAERDWKKPGGGEMQMNARYQRVKPFACGGIFQKQRSA